MTGGSRRLGDRTHMSGQPTVACPAVITKRQTLPKGALSSETRVEPCQIQARESDTDEKGRQHEPSPEWKSVVIE